MKLFNTIAAILLFTQASFGLIGVESGGGGDPQAVDFLLKTRVVAAWIKSGGGGGEISEDKRELVSSIARRLSVMMDNSRQTPIVMVDRDLVDASGASKVAVFSMQPLKIEITRSKWKQLSEEEKYVTAGLELLGIAQVKERYKIAGTLQNNIQSVLQLSLIVGATKEFQGPQWAYFALAKVFPEFNESIGGNSREMILKSLLCSSSLTQIDGNPAVQTECTATDEYGKTITRSAADLFLTLQISAGAMLDVHSEPGAVYFQIEDMDCGVLEPSSSGGPPQDPEYFCSGKVLPPQAQP